MAIGSKRRNNGSTGVLLDELIPTEDTERSILVMKETHTILRTLSITPDGQTTFNVSDVDLYLNSWLADGWTILSFQYVGSTPEGWMFAWCLVR